MSHPDAFFRYCQGVKIISSIGEDKSKYTLPKEIIDAVKRVDPTADPWMYLSNTPGDSMSDMAWRYVWFNYYFWPGLMPLYTSKTPYTVNDIETKIRIDVTTKQKLFSGRSDSIKAKLVDKLNKTSGYTEDDAWEEYMIYGGLPQVAQFSVERQKAEYLKNIFTNVYIKDVVERNKIQNVDEIGTLVDILASAIGAPTNPTKISNTFKSERGINYSNKTISNHIDYLAEAFLISKADRYDIKGRKYVGANLKYYFSDIGLRNARLNFRQQEPTHIMENIVYNELLVRGYNVDVGIVDVFAKNSDGKRVHKQLEVDFVVNQGSQRYYIQVAYDMTSEEKQTQELNSLRNIPDSFKKIVIVNGTKKPWRNEEGFVIMGMKYFLLNEDSLEF